MSKPTNQKLYDRIKNTIKRELDSKGQRWSARASQQLVKRYQDAGGGYSGKKKENEGLNKWQKEDWVAINSSGDIVGPCGSDKTDSGKQYRCLPRAKANNMTKQERAATAKKKLKTPDKVVSNIKKADTMIDSLNFNRGSYLLRDFVNTDIAKAKKMPIGTVSNGRKKVAEGKWVAVASEKKEPKGLTKLRQASFNQGASHHAKAVRVLQSKIKQLQKEDASRSPGQKRNIAINEMKQKVKFHTALYHEKK